MAYQPSVETVALKILIFNVGKNNKSPTDPKSQNRARVILKVIEEKKPNIVLFQEFKSVLQQWKTHPEYFKHIGNEDASILYPDTEYGMAHKLDESCIKDIITGLQTNAYNRLREKFPGDFNPLSRMCIVKVTSAINLIIISFHGWSNKLKPREHKPKRRGKMSDDEKITYFKYLMVFVEHIKDQCKLPVLIAGDFNVKIELIERYVASPFCLCKYEASARRENAVIDYYIISEELIASNIKSIDLTKICNAEEEEEETKIKRGLYVNALFDHDPIVATIQVAPSLHKRIHDMESKIAQMEQMVSMIGKEIAVMIQNNIDYVDEQIHILERRLSSDLTLSVP